MRAAGFFSIVFASLLAFGVYHFLHRGSSCQRFGSDVALAVTAPDEAPDPGDHGALEPGSCSFLSTTKAYIHAFGWERHSKHTIAGRMYIGGGDQQALRDDKRAMKQDGSFTFTPLPKLGRGAFLATRVKPEDPAAPSFGGLPDPANALPLPATVFWVSAHFGSVSVSASGDGATLEQAQRASIRLAELVNRRPVHFPS